MFPPSNDFSSIMPGNSFAVDKNSAVSPQDEPTPLFWHFPAHFIDEDDDGLLMSHLLSQANQQILSYTSNLEPLESEIHPASPIKETKKVVTKRKRATTGSNNGAKQGIPRKRTGKKDRHSKIYTAHGPRDRRMRLSLQIARKFFDLQDMLGFDKASKTIEWLFSKSKAAIKELTDNLPGVKHSCSTGGGKSASSTSESEVLSGSGSAAKECEDNNTGEQQGVVARVASSTAREANKERKSPRKPSFNPIARESRDKARARARERTIEKMKMRGLEISKKCSDESNPNELERLQSSSPLETGKILGSSTTHTNPTTSPKVVTEEEEQRPADADAEHHQSSVRLLEHEMDSVSIIEKFLGIGRSAAPRSSSSVFNYSVSHHIADSSGRGEISEESCPIISGNWSVSNDRNRIRYGYCSAMTNIKDSTGNVQEKNPNIIFMANTQEENPSSNLMVNSYARLVSHNSDLMTPSNSNTSPTSIFIMPTSSDIIAGLHSQYQEKPTVASRYHKPSPFPN